MLKFGIETHLTCTSPGFSGLYKDRISTCSGTSLYPYPGISSQCCRTYKALCSISTDKFSSATSLLFLTEASAAGHSQAEDKGFWPVRVMSGHQSPAQEQEMDWANKDLSRRTNKSPFEGGEQRWGEWIQYVAVMREMAGRKKTSQEKCNGKGKKEFILALGKRSKGHWGGRVPVGQFKSPHLCGSPNRSMNEFLQRSVTITCHTQDMQLCSLLVNTTGNWLLWHSKAKWQFKTKSSWSSFIS